MKYSNELCARFSVFPPNVCIALMRRELSISFSFIWVLTEGRFSLYLIVRDDLAINVENGTPLENYNVRTVPAYGICQTIGMPSLNKLHELLNDNLN